MIRIIRKREGKADAAQKLIDALQARRGAGRRDPRDEALPAGPARDPGDPEGARGEARRGQARSTALLKDTQEALGRGEGRAGRDRKASTATSGAPRSAARSTRPSISEEAFIVDEDANVILTRDGWVKRVREVKDPAHHAPARGRRGDRGARRARSRANLVLLLRLRRRLRQPLQRHPGVHRLRRSGAEAVQVRRRRARGRRRCRSTRALPQPGEAARPSRKQRLRAALRAGAAHRGLDPRRPPLRASPARATRSSACSPVGDKRPARGASPSTTTRSVCKVDEVNELAGPGKGVTVIKVERRTTGWSASSRTATKDASIDARDRARARSSTLSPAGTR